MDFFNPWYLLMGLISSSIGFGAFLYGKRVQDAKALFVGLLLMGVSYFVTDPLALLAITTALTALLFSQQLQAWWMGPPKKIEVVPVGKSHRR